MRNDPLEKTAGTQVSIDPHGLEHLAENIQRLGKTYRSAVILSDENVFPFYGEQVAHQLMSLEMRVEHIILPPGEKTKSFETVYACWDRLLKLRMDRQSLLVTLGGGVISDLGGFLASTFMRGIDLIHLPTTLLGMIDAAIGGKTGVNMPEAKNMIGTFYHPKLVLIDSSTLETLPEREYKAGIAELIKYGVIADPQLFSFLEQNMQEILNKEPGKLETVISRGCEIKSAIVMQDPQDLHSIRATLNYGHTFAHAIENLLGYDQLLHGEAVSIGMSCAAHLAHHLNLVSQDFVKRQDHLCSIARLPIKMPQAISTEHLLDAMEKDKKAVAGHLTFILPQGFGQVAQVRRLERQTVIEALQRKE